MNNVEINFDKKSRSLVITIDLKKKGQPSKSGKSFVVASTHGNVDVGNGFKLGLNCFKAIPMDKITD